MARAAVSELVVPLRNAWNITRYKRAPRAIQIIKNEVVKHLKVREDEEVWIDRLSMKQFGQGESRTHLAKSVFR